MSQRIFSPIDSGFRWTVDNKPASSAELAAASMDRIWYQYDGKAAEIAARQARDAFAKEMKARGYRVTKFSLGKQLMSCGGIGSGRPHIELVVPCYGVNFD